MAWGRRRAYIVKRSRRGRVQPAGWPVPDFASRPAATVMKTFHVHTLGCKVNHYEGEQVAAVLRSFGLVETDASHADLRVVNTCSVTGEAAAKSRQASRRMVRLPVLDGRPSVTTVTQDCMPQRQESSRRPRVIVTGCWATSDCEMPRRTGCRGSAAPRW